MLLFLVGCTQPSIEETSQQYLKNPEFVSLEKLEEKYSTSSPIVISYSGLSIRASEGTADYNLIRKFQNKYPFIRVQYYKQSELSMISGNYQNVVLGKYGDSIIPLISKKLYNLNSFLNHSELGINLNDFPLEFLNTSSLQSSTGRDYFAIPVGFTSSGIVENTLFNEYFQTLNSEFPIHTWQKVFNYSAKANDTFNNEKDNLIGSILYKDITANNFFQNAEKINPLPSNIKKVGDFRSFEENFFSPLSLTHSNFDVLLRQRGVEPLLVKTIDSVDANIFNENTIEFMNYLENSFNNKFITGYIDNVYFSQFHLDYPGAFSPYTLLNSAYLKEFHRYFDVDIFKLHPLPFHEENLAFLDIDPYQVVVNHKENISPDELTASWLLAKFVSTEGNIHYAKNSAISPISKLTINSIDYMNFLDENPFLNAIDEYHKEFYLNESSYKYYIEKPFRLYKAYQKASYEMIDKIQSVKFHPEFINIPWSNEEKLNYYYSFLK